jgi:hypothetical protein
MWIVVLECPGQRSLSDAVVRFLRDGVVRNLHNGPLLTLVLNASARHDD